MPGERLVAMVQSFPDETDPWSGILQRIQCGSCHSVIPAHLGERWDEISVEEAKHEWQTVYRSTQPKIDQDL